MTIDTSRVPDLDVFLDGLTLHAGAHEPDHTFCVMEAAAYVAGEPWSDHPKCVSPVIGAFLRSWNDTLPGDQRQMLTPLIPLVLNTNDDRDEERAWMATDWLVRTFAPAWLDLAGLTDHAANLRGLDALTSAELARTGQAIIEDAQRASAAAGAAARDAAWAAAWDADWAAAWDAAWAAARDAAWAAARDAAWAAAGDAGWAAAGAAARDAAWAAARDAAWAAAKTKRTPASARKAADVALAPTVASLQESALDLVRRMTLKGTDA